MSIEQSNQPEQNPDVPSTGNEAKKRTRIVFSGITPEGARRLETHFRNLREQGIPWMMEGHEVLEIGAVFDHDNSELE